MFKYAIAMMPTLAAMIATCAAAEVTKDSDNQDHASLRHELASCWHSYDAWKYFHDGPAPFDEFRNTFEGSIDQAWTAFVSEQQRRGADSGQRFTVTPEIAKELSDYLRQETKDAALTFGAYSDVLWETARDRFRAFLSKHADNAFAPEVNAKMAELVQRDPLLRNDRSAQMLVATVYFRRAVRGYGKQFSYPALHARSTLANWAGSVQALLEDYEWQIDFIEHGTEVDLHSVQSVAWFIKGQSIQFPRARLAHRLKAAKANLTRTVTHHTIPTIIRRSSPLDLDRIMQAYPDTELTKKAGDSEYAIRNRTLKELEDMIRDYPDATLAEFAKIRLARKRGLTTR